MHLFPTPTIDKSGHVESIIYKYSILVLQHQSEVLNDIGGGRGGVTSSSRGKGIKNITLRERIDFQYIPGEMSYARAILFKQINEVRG